MHLVPTYRAIPLVTAACFFAAALDAWLTVARGSILSAGLLGVLWLGLLFAALRGGNIEATAFVAAIVTLVGAGLASHWLESLFGVPPALARVGLVDGVLLGLAVANSVVARRERARASAVARRRPLD